MVSTSTFKFKAKTASVLKVKPGSYAEYEAAKDSINRIMNVPAGGEGGMFPSDAMPGDFPQVYMAKIKSWIEDPNNANDPHLQEAKNDYNTFFALLKTTTAAPESIQEKLQREQYESTRKMKGKPIPVTNS